jgi:hypothetical protein
MKKLTIKTPLWKYKAIGIKSSKVTDDFEIKIAYRTKDEELLYPDTYFMTKEEIQKFPIRTFGRLSVYLIPIDNLKIKEIYNG